MALTAIEIKNLKPKSKPYKVSDSDGLYLEVKPSGKKYWRLKYRIHGKENRISLGAFPDVSILQAREASIKEKKAIMDGIDPALQRKRDKINALHQAKNDFESVAREWHQINYPRWKKRHADEILRRMEANLFPHIGRIPVAELTAPEVLHCLRKLEERKAYEMAKRCQQLCDQVMRFSVQTGRVTQNFVPNLRGALISRPSTPFACIEPDEIPKFLAALEKNKAEMFEQTTLAIKMLLLTFVRTNELIKANWKEFDLEKKQWVVPVERMKMNKEHIVPLSEQVIMILSKLKALNPKNELVFPSISKPRKSMSNNTILKALDRLGYKGKMTGHGFRALAMTTLKEKLNYSHDVIDRQLAHVPKSSVDRAYDRSKFIEERKKMMQDWANYIDKQNK